MTEWAATIRIPRIAEVDTDDIEAVRKFCAVTSAALAKSHCMASVAEEFNILSAPDEDTDVDELVGYVNDTLDQMYELADIHRIWIDANQFGDRDEG